MRGDLHQRMCHSFVWQVVIAQSMRVFRGRKSGRERAGVGLVAERVEAEPAKDAFDAGSHSDRAVLLREIAICRGPWGRAGDREERLSAVLGSLEATQVLWCASTYSVRRTACQGRERVLVGRRRVGSGEDLV